jgi:PKD repeat protein
MNFFDYNAAGQTDDLLLPVIDLTTAIHPVFYFDVAYRQYTGSSDALKIEISTDCGTTYTPSTYNKSGATLATVTPPVTTKFSPTLASQWRKDTLDLTPYIGNKIRLKMVGMCGYGNDLFIDNFEIKEYISGNTPVANFTISPNNCIGGTTTFTDASPTTGITAWSWNFGTGATPTTASTQGPHTITYNTGGNKTSTLTISTAAGSVNTSQTIVVNAPTTASFNYTTPAPTTLTFNNTSTNANSYLWQFGNGGTSTQANPTYTYTTNGTYTIVLRTQNNCNTSADTTIVQIPIVSTNDLQGWAAKVYPNPANDQVTIQIPNLQETIATISITDLIGKNLYIHTTADPSGSTNINTEKLTSGPYIIEIKMADKVYRTKLNILK